MWGELLLVGQEMLDSLLSIWPYLLITIPIAVGVKVSGAAKHINRVLGARPLLAIIGATLIGAFSPLCACGVVPLIASLLIGGVPLAPIMAFWIASPTMDVEIFFLSVGFLGWDLAVWRLATTLVLSLGAGFFTHWLMLRGWLGNQSLRADYSIRTSSTWEVLRKTSQVLAARMRRIVAPALTPMTNMGIVAAADNDCCDAPVSNLPMSNAPRAQAGKSCCSETSRVSIPRIAASSIVEAVPATAPAGSVHTTDVSYTTGASCAAEDSCALPADSAAAQPGSFARRLWQETGEATLLVAKFMAFAFVLQAVIKLYVPEAWIIAALGAENPFAIFTASLLGMPVYTSNLAVLPMIGGLLDQGMNPAAALAFLISGPMLTLPSMAAVWGLATRRVFLIYVSFAFVGALVAGYAYSVSSRIG